MEDFKELEDNSLLIVKEEGDLENYYSGNIKSLENLIRMKDEERNTESDFKK